MQPTHLSTKRKNAPPTKFKLPAGPECWLVTSYADARKVFADPSFGRADLFSGELPDLVPSPNMIEDPDNLTNLDGADHRRLRGLLQRTFTPSAIALWRPWIESVVAKYVSALHELPDGFDLIAEFTHTLPVSVITRLMGLPVAREADMLRWSEISLTTEGVTLDDIQKSNEEFKDWARELMAARRAEPGEDLISYLVQRDDGTIPEGQLTTLVCVLIMAGHETTMSMLGNFLVYLLAYDREAWAALRTADDDKMERIVEDLLRITPLGDRKHRPGPLRYTKADIVVGGVQFRKGDVVAIDVVASNHDPEFHCPVSKIDTEADLEVPHLTFSSGPHLCIGAWLARWELGLALRGLARAFPDLTLADDIDELTWIIGMVTRSPRKLRVNKGIANGAA
ncbi:cytochrome P450 [Nocardia sp. NPDC057030]|uniref:cytochrome P450 n=1 Tax=unclassified Nocardia TaxID=2637762 RepID=UPI00362D9CD0